MTSLDTTGRLSFQGNQLASKYKERWMSTMTEACYWSKRGKYHILGHTGAPGMDHQVMVLGFMQERIQEWTKVTPAIPLLDIHTEETRIERDTYTPMCITALFIISRTGKQSRCPSADEWIRNLWYICTMKYSVQFSCSVVSDFLQPHESQHARPPCPLPTSGVHSDSCPLSQWCHPAISSSVIPFSSCPQSLPTWGSFPMSQLFAWGGQSTGASALASFLPKKSQGWSPSEWTGWISLQSKGLSRVFSNTTVQKHQFFGTQPSSQSSSHIHTWPLEKP